MDTIYIYTTAIQLLIGLAIAARIERTDYLNPLALLQYQFITLRMSAHFQSVTAAASGRLTSLIVSRVRVRLRRVGCSQSYTCPRKSQSDATLLTGPSQTGCDRLMPETRHACSARFPVVSARRCDGRRTVASMLCRRL